MPCQEEKLK